MIEDAISGVEAVIKIRTTLSAALSSGGSSTDVVELSLTKADIAFLIALLEDLLR